MLFLTLLACESGLSLQVDVTVPADVSAAYGPEAPGLVRVLLDGAIVDVVSACGQTFHETLPVYRDLGFGCLEERDDASTTAIAWIEPAPETWDHPALCQLDAAREGLDLSTVVPEGDETVLAEEPDAAWPQGSADLPWKRDLSPCGGQAEGEIGIEG